MDLKMDTEVLERWRRLMAEDREQALELYFEQLLPRLLPHLKQLEAHSRIPESRCETLISLMGLSPETTVIATALLRPKRVLVIRSRGLSGSFNRAAKFMVEQGMLSFSDLPHEEVDPTSPVEIYETIRRHIRGRDTESAVVDVTGGKKVMSASAALAASELGIPLCYIDGQYDPQLRSPVLGTERLIFLPNPSTYRAEIARQEAITVYETRDFVSARGAFERSRDLQPRSAQFEDLALSLCRVYVGWADLDLETLLRHLAETRALLRKPGVAQLVGDGIAAAAHLDALELVGKGDSLAMLATLLELSRQYRERGRNDFSCLLSYRALEGFVQYGLAQLAGGDFDPANPNYAKLGGEQELTERFSRLARELGHGQASALPARLGLIDGFMILCLVGDVHQSIYSKLSLVKVVQQLKGVAHLRNRSVLAHGLRNLSEADSKRLLDESDRFGRGMLGARFAELESIARNLAPIRLRQLASS